MRDPRERLQDILEAIEKVERHAARGKEVFLADELVQSWIVRHLQILGEAARGVPKEIRDLAPAIPWSSLTGMRHVIVHDYFEVDTEIVWGVVERELPRLKSELQRLIAELPRR